MQVPWRVLTLVVTTGSVLPSGGGSVLICLRVAIEKYLPVLRLMTTPVAEATLRLSDRIRGGIEARVGNEYAAAGARVGDDPVVRGAVTVGFGRCEGGRPGVGGPEPLEQLLHRLAEIVRVVVAQMGVGVEGVQRTGHRFQGGPPRQGDPVEVVEAVHVSHSVPPLRSHPRRPR